MRKITGVDSIPLATGIQAILLDMYKTEGVAKYPIYEFERLIMERHECSIFDAKMVTAKILATGIIREKDKCFIL